MLNRQWVLVGFMLLALLLAPHLAVAQEAGEVPAEAQDHLANAQDYERGGQYGLALVELDQALALAPEWADAIQLQPTVQAEADAAVAQAAGAAASPPPAPAAA